MRWGGERESSNVEDRRGGGFGGGGGGRIQVGGRGIGLGTIAIALVAGWIFGIDPLTILGVISGGGPEVVRRPEPSPRQGGDASRTAQDEHSRFVSVVLASTEDTWNEIFRRGQAQYQPPKLVLFSGRTDTAVWAMPPRARSTAPATASSTSTCVSSTCCASASRRPATWRRPT